MNQWEQDEANRAAKAAPVATAAPQATATAAPKVEVAPAAPPVVEPPVAPPVETATEVVAEVHQLQTEVDALAKKVGA